MTRPTNVTVCNAWIVVIGLSWAIVEPTVAQTPPYNRSIASLQVVEAGNGLQRLICVAQLKATGFAVLNYDLVLMINGVQQTFSQDETYNWATGGCSATDACSGCPATYSCIVGVPGAGCACGKWITYQSDPTSIPAGSIAEAFIQPARGGASEIDTSDDAKILIPTPEPSSWNRGIDLVDVEQVAGGKQRVRVDMKLEATGQAILNYDLVLMINGLQQTFEQDETYNWATGGCSASDACSGCPATYSCIVGVPGAGCACGKWITYHSDPTTIPAGSTVEAFLRPARGGYPEIDTGDDIYLWLDPDPSDVNRDGVTDIKDLEALIGCMGGPDQPASSSCAPNVDTDIDDDNDVDALDYLRWQQNIG